MFGPYVFMFVLLSLSLLAAWCAGADEAWPRCPAGARAACDAAAPRRTAGWLTRDYVVDGKRLTVLIHNESDVLVWRCSRSRSVSLGAAAPAFPAPRRAATVHLIGCQAPPDRSYSELLQQLNISSTTRLGITSHSTRPFDALLTKMILSELSVHSEQLVELENDFAHFDDTLKRFSLKKISMTTDQFMSLRNNYDLSLIECGLEEIPDLSLFSKLERLAVREGRLQDARQLATAPALRTLVLEAPDAAMAAMPRLNNATFTNAYAMGRIFGNCSELENLSVVRGSLSELRAGWLENCARLQRLDLNHNALEALPDSLLSGAVALTFLDLSHNRLRALPGDLLKQTTHLTHLNVSHNLLTVVPDEFLFHTGQLFHLDLSHNQITAVPSTLLSATSELKHLNLSHNQLTALPDSFLSSAIEIARDLDLDLSYNKLNELSDDFLAQKNFFKNLNLSHNVNDFEF